MKHFSFFFFFFFFLIYLQFYDPVITVKVMLRWSVNLHTFFLGRISKCCFLIFSLSIQKLDEPNMITEAFCSGELLNTNWCAYQNNRENMILMMMMSLMMVETGYDENDDGFHGYMAWKGIYTPLLFDLLDE